MSWLAVLPHLLRPGTRRRAEWVGLRRFALVKPRPCFILTIRHSPRRLSHVAVIGDRVHRKYVFATLVEAIGGSTGSLLMVVASSSPSS